MVAFTLESLVLRGVVRQGELGVVGFGLEAGPQNRRGINSAIPSDADMPATDPTPAGGDAPKGASPRAGRSCRHGGSPSYREVATRAGTVWRQTGGLARAAAAKALAKLAGLAASVGGGGPRLAALTVIQGRQEPPR